jgi:hypothetical protein
MRGVAACIAAALSIWRYAAILPHGGNHFHN